MITGGSGSAGTANSADDAAAGFSGSGRAANALSMKVPSTGGGEIRRGGSGPRHGPRRGGDRGIRNPHEESTDPRRPRHIPGGSTTVSTAVRVSLHTENETSPALDGDLHSQNLRDGEGKPASSQNS